VGNAAFDLHRARNVRQQVEGRSAYGLTDRYRLRRTEKYWRREETESEAVWQRLAAPEMERLDAKVEEAENRVAELGVHCDRYRSLLTLDPAGRRLSELDHDIDRTDALMLLERVGARTELRRGQERHASPSYGIELGL